MLCDADSLLQVEMSRLGSCGTEENESGLFKQQLEQQLQEAAGLAWEQKNQAGVFNLNLNIMQEIIF